MSHSSGTSGSSLLHLYRPPQLQQSNRPKLHIAVQDELDTDSNVPSFASSPSSSIIHSSTIFCPPASGPTMKLDTHRTAGQFLQEPKPMRRTLSEGEVSAASTMSISPEREGCVDILRSVQPSGRIAKPRSEWQADEDCALCTHPLCSTMFGATLSLGPRRHHCRMCGFIFCNRHSTARVPLHTATDGTNGRRLVISRVCDGCFSVQEDLTACSRRSSDATPSLVNSETSAKDDLVVDPQDHIRVSLTRSLSSSAVVKAPTLAPIEDWMDRSGILSLYPLAAQASHSRRTTAMHAAGPLFFPTMSERRSAQAKEVKRVNSRRRRHNVRMWVSTPVGSDNDSDDEEEDTMSPMLSPMASPLRRKNDNTTPVGRVLDWSTF